MYIKYIFCFCLCFPAVNKICLDPTLQMFAGIYRDFAGKSECGDFRRTCNPRDNYMHFSGHVWRHRDPLHFLWGKNLQCTSKKCHEIQTLQNSIILLCLAVQQPPIVDRPIDAFSTASRRSSQDQTTQYGVKLFLKEYLYQGFHQIQYQAGVKSTVSGVFEDLKFKISEGYKQH